MLATLNLQLAAVELPDETLKTTAELLPSQGTEPAAGFADLLSLRVADALEQGPVSGDLLPLAGSQLPLPPEADPLSLSVQAPAVDDLATPLPVVLLPDGLTPVDAMDLAGDFDLGLDSEVLYPPALPGLKLATESTSVTPAAALPGRIDTTTTPAALDADAAKPVTLTAGTPQTAPLPVTLPASPRAATTAGPQRTELPTDGNVLPERAPIDMTRNAAPPPMDRAAVPPPDVERTLPVSPELQRRPEQTASQRADALAQAVTELVRPRPVVNQVVQTLQSQLNTQQSPVFHTPVSAPIVATDTTYSSAMQQATDLIGTPVRDAAWGDRIGERVVMMAGNQMKNAEIRLTPAELGPLRIQVAVEDGATHVTFHAQHALTRDAIEQALPRLRDMLAENGLSLGDAHVGEEGAPQGNRDGQSDSDTGLSSRSVSDGHSGGATESQGATAVRITGAGLVDTFA